MAVRQQGEAYLGVWALGANEQRRGRGGKGVFAMARDFGGESASDIDLGLCGDFSGTLGAISDSRRIRLVRSDFVSP